MGSISSTKNTMGIYVFFNTIREVDGGWGKYRGQRWVGGSGTGGPYFLACLGETWPGDLQPRVFKILSTNPPGKAMQGINLKMLKKENCHQIQLMRSEFGGLLGMFFAMTPHAHSRLNHCLGRTIGEDSSIVA